ncbi:hypothetical protein N8015_03845 [Planktomarina temperata]|nr:hypothetical protein [Planktomarina temperata]
MSLMIAELIKEVIKRIEASEGRSRSRTTDEQQRFEHAVYVLLADLWKAVKSTPIRECSINKRSGWYSENPRYRDPLLTYKQMIAVFDGLLRIGFIEVTEKGYYDRVTLQGGLTRFVAGDELLERLQELDGHPAIAIKPDLDAETIILRNKVDDRKVLQEYEDTPATERHRANLKKINSCFVKHWCDLEVQDTELAKLAERIANHATKEPIDFSQRTLVRIFSNGSFKQGGRFYRAWWLNVPSEYRKYITIDEKRTAEFDFSQLNPHLLYHSNYKELGSEDAYDRVLDGEHRKVVKQAFNAMVQASTPLKNCPNELDMSGLEMSWAELRDRIIKAHKPIADLFFKGVGNHLQFQDSNIAERVMLHFAGMDAPALPVHDSFILHHAYGESGEVEEAMRRAFHDEMREPISKIDKEILTWSYRKDEDDTEETRALDLDAILSGDDDVSQCRERHQLWYAQR